MKALMAGVISAALVAPTIPQAEPAKVPSPADMHRFLLFAVFEGLWEDGADVTLIRTIRANPWTHFVAKCPICDAVGQGMDVYAAAPRSLLNADREVKGIGLPAEIAAELKSETRETRLAGLEHLVERYVKRRFKCVRMTDEETRQMRRLLDEGWGAGMSAKEEKFGSFCPSCNGATGRKPKK